MPGVIVDGNDVTKVYEVVGKAVKAARMGKGPTLVECKTYRFRGHFEGDPNLGERYRDKEEIKRWMAKCPIKKLKGEVLKKKLATKREIELIEKEISRQIEDAMRYAEASPFPDGEETLEDLFV